MKLTCAVHHISLSSSNPGKLVKLDALAAVYLPLVQQYVTHFCTAVAPAKFAPPCFESALSERWQPVAIQHAAGLAQSWQTSRANAFQDYLDELAEYEEGHAEGEAAPTWEDWQVPTFRLGDKELQACQSRVDIKALLGRSHMAWQVLQRVPVVHPPA